MCDRCVEIDDRVEQLRKLGSRILDPETLRSIDVLIRELEIQKAALHFPDQ
jgi:hypothetical protein